MPGGALQRDHIALLGIEQGISDHGISYHIQFLFGAKTLHLSTAD